MLVDQRDLVDDIGECRGIPGRQRVLGIEGAAHVDAIEPHLIGIHALVPEAARRGPRLRAQLLAQEIRRAPVALVTRPAREREEELARIDVVDVVVAHRVRRDLAARRDETIDVAPDVLAVALVAGRLTDGRDALQQDTPLVVPALGHDRLTAHRRVRRPTRPRRRDRCHWTTSVSKNCSPT